MTAYSSLVVLNVIIMSTFFTLKDQFTLTTDEETGEAMIIKGATSELPYQILTYSYSVLSVIVANVFKYLVDKWTEEENNQYQSKYDNHKT